MHIQQKYNCIFPTEKDSAHKRKWNRTAVDQKEMSSFIRMMSSERENANADAILLTCSLYWKMENANTNYEQLQLTFERKSTKFHSKIYTAALRKLILAIPLRKSFIMLLYPASDPLNNKMAHLNTPECHILPFSS